MSETEKNIVEKITRAVDILPPLQRERFLGQAEGVLLHAEAVKARAQTETDKTEERPA